LELGAGANWPTIVPVGTNNVGIEVRVGTSVATGVYGAATVGNLTVWSNSEFKGNITGNGSGLTNLTAQGTLTNFSVYAAGTAYSLTGTSALLDFGTTDPSVTINQAGISTVREPLGQVCGGCVRAPQLTVAVLRDR